MRPTPFVARIFAIICAAAMLALPLGAPAVGQVDTKKKTGKLKLGDLFNQGGGLSVGGPKVSSSISPKKVKEGDVVTFSVTIDLPPLAHVTPQKSKSDFGIPVSFTKQSLVGLKEVDKEFTTKSKPKTEVDPETGDKEIYLEGKITWTKRLRVVDAGSLPTVAATVRFNYQICTAGRCKPPTFKKLVAKATVESSQKPQSVKPKADKADKTEKTTKTESGKKKSEEQTVFPYQVKDPEVNLASDMVDVMYALTPKNAAPGETVTVTITATFAEKWHAFALTHDSEAADFGLPVKIKVLKVRGLTPSGKGWRPDQAPKRVPTKTGQALEHFGTVTWKRTFKVTPGVAVGEYGVAGRFSYQICTGNKCRPEKRLRFALGDLTNAEEAPQDSNTIDKSPFPLKVTAKQPVDTSKLLWYLLLAFAGGLILNVMPCVLPVIAIKVMSFVQQAGEDRKRVFILNSVYGLGVISVFLLLATLAVFAGYGWGGLFQRSEFTLIMGVVVFAMALSLLGVFEIPIPGLLGSAAGKQQSEGPGGAFLTGVFATILATPCSGPFLGVTLAWSVQQEAAVTYLVWATMGLGMAFPYLVFAVFPKATSLLPKPGNWMVRFKEISGFVLMGTTVWIVQSLKKPELFYTLILLSASGFSLWMIGQLYQPTTPRSQKWLVRSLAFAVVLFALFAGSHVLPHVSEKESPMFHFLQRWDMLSLSAVLLGVALAALPFKAAMSSTVTAGRRWLLHGTAMVLTLIGVLGAFFAQTFDELPWQAYSEQKLNDEIANGNIVMIDFTADW